MLCYQPIGENVTPGRRLGLLKSTLMQDRLTGDRRVTALLAETEEAVIP